MPACSGCRQGGSGWGGSCSPQHNKRPGFNEKGEAAPVFPWHAASDWHRHTFITSFVHCNVNVPSSSPPSALRRFTKSESERRRELCPFFCLLLSCHPYLPLVEYRCGMGGQPVLVPGVCSPSGHQASFHTAASFKLFPKFQMGSEELQPKYLGDVATGPFVTVKTAFLLPLSNLLLMPSPALGLHGGSHLGPS